MSLATTQDWQPASPAQMRGTAWLLAGTTLPFLAVWLAPGTVFAGYVPLHTFMETIAIVVSMLIFGVAWHAYSGERPGNVLILACGFLAVGLIDFAHMISFPGMPGFVTPAGLEKAINFWLAARLIAAGTLLLVALRRWEPFAAITARVLLLAISLALTGLVYWVVLYTADLLPPTFVAAKGLTPFKIGAEYFIIAVLAAAAWLFLRHALRRGSFSALCLFAACSVSLLSELCFTLYSDVADLINVLGHLYKIAAYALIYRAVFVDSVRSPFEQLARARQETEQCIVERTANLDQANISLRDANARLRATLNTVVDGIITIDDRGIVETINPAAERMFGYAADEVIGGNVKMLMPEPYHSEHDGYIENYRVTGKAGVIGVGREVMGRRKNGSTFPLDLAVSEMWLGSERHYTGVVRDNTARKQAEEALLRGEALQSAIFNSANFSSIATDANGVIQIFNVGAERMLGYAAADVTNKITPADLSDPREVIARAEGLSRELGSTITPGFQALVFKASRGIEDIYELTYIRKDGSRFPAVVSVTALRDVENTIIGYLLIGTDNTARKRIEEQLRWTEESFRLMVESVTDYSIVMLNPEGAVASWNSGAQRINGYDAEEIVGQHFSIFYPREAIDHGLQVPDLAATAAARRVEVEGRRPRQDGSTFWANVVITAILDKGDNLRGFAKVTRDLTERRKVEAALTSAKSAAEEANLAKSDFLANMSHELRTPLNSIIGFSEMLKDGVLGELDTKQRDFVVDIHGSGTHLLSLINDILDLSKVEAGALQLEAGAVDVRALLKASTLVVREKALAHRIRLDTALDPGLGTMLADERKLKQIVYNLLSNAVKFTADGGAVTLHARRCARAEVALDTTMPGRLLPLPPGEDGEFLAITVEDSGAGIAEQDLSKLYEPFMQVDSSVARRHAGTGLGLSLVRRLAELHGGTVGVTSRPGAGSRFCVWLPYRAAAGAAQEGGPGAERMAASWPAVPLALVIEDDDGAAELIATQLRAQGFAVMRVATAEEGLVRAAKRPPQLITLDIFLPNMDGWEFMRRLKATPQLADTPMVVITVSDDLERGLMLGARRVLQKPFVHEELVAALAGLVDVGSDGEPGRLLVVDDNVTAVQLLATALEAEGYRVMRAYGGAEAIRVARSALPDLLILDLIMPGVSGFEVARALRDSEQTTRIPILVLTAKDLTAEDHARLNGDVIAILEKTNFSTGELLAEVRRALPKRGAD